MELVRGVIAEDPVAVDGFLQRMRCVTIFVTAANSRRGQPLDADSLRDVVQDVLTVIWRRISDYRGDAGLETWAYRVCELQMRNAIRRAKPRRMQPLADDVVDSRRDCAETAQEDQAVESALSRLRPLDAKIVRYKLLEAMPFECIARQLEQRPNTVKTRYYRALHKLRWGSASFDRQPA